MDAVTDYAGRLLGGRYRVERQLGAGGMGVVYAAWQEDLGRRVAVKLMSAGSSEALQRFRLEAQTAASLGNPHIVQVFDFQMSSDEPAFIVMELVEGPSLRALVKNDGPLSEERAARLGVQVLSALDAAHRAGILHRDIKPANLMVSSSPTLGEVSKVLDFGIAKLTSDVAAPLTQAGSVLGTASYMSPEQARGEALDGRSDVYSLAATLFFACTGESALDIQRPEDRLRAVVEGRVRRLVDVRPTLDPAFCGIIARGLAAERDARFSSAQEMASALEAWRERRAANLAQRAPAATPDAVLSQLPRSFETGPMMPAAAGPMAPPSPARRRSPWTTAAFVVIPLVAIGGVALAAVAAAGYYYFHADPVAERAASGSNVSSPSPTASAATAPPAAPTATREQRANKPTGSPGAATAAPLPAAPSPATAAGPTPSAPPKLGGGFGASCTRESDCSELAACEDGKCVCHWTTCGSDCVNTSRDVRNCGGCGKACLPGEHCMVSICTSCNTNVMKVCNGVCTVVTNNIKHCGACGNQCPPGRSCFDGKCQQ